MRGKLGPALWDACDSKTPLKALIRFANNDAPAVPGPQQHLLALGELVRGGLKGPVHPAPVLACSRE